MLASRNCIRLAIAFLCCLFFFSIESVAQDFNGQEVFFQAKHSGKNLRAIQDGAEINAVQSTPVWNNDWQLFKIIRTCLLYTSPSPRDRG